MTSLVESASFFVFVVGEKLGSSNHNGGDYACRFSSSLLVVFITSIDSIFCVKVGISLFINLVTIQ